MITTQLTNTEEVLNQIDLIEEEEVKELVLALIKHRLRISRATYYRKCETGFDPDAIEVIQKILTRWTGNDAPVLD